MSLNTTHMGHKTSLKSTNFYHKNLQLHTESNPFGLFLNLNIAGTPHLNELISWIYIYNIQQVLRETMSKLASLLCYLTLNFLKNMLR